MHSTSGSDIIKKPFTWNHRNARCVSELEVQCTMNSAKIPKVGTVGFILAQGPPGIGYSTLAVGGGVIYNVSETTIYTFVLLKLWEKWVINDLISQSYMLIKGWSDNSHSFI